MQKSSQKTTAEAWTAPRLTRLGTIGQVAAQGNATTQGGANKS